MKPNLKSKLFFAVALSSMLISLGQTAYSQCYLTGQNCQYYINLSLGTYGQLIVGQTETMTVSTNAPPSAGSVNIVIYVVNETTGQYTVIDTGGPTFTWTPTTTGNYEIMATGFISGGEGATLVPAYFTLRVLPVPYQGIIYPKYVVLGVTYAPPGSNSFVQYSTGTTFGTTTSYSSSVANETDYSQSFSLGASIPKGVTELSGSVTWTETISTDFTQTSNSSNSITVSYATTNTFKQNGYPTTNSPNGPPPPALPNDYDTVLLWLNAELGFNAFPATASNPAFIQWLGYGIDPSDQDGPDIYPVQVGCLNGDFSAAYCATQQAVLNRQWVSAKVSPSNQAPLGAYGCSPQSANSPSICPLTQDAYNILAADPLAYNPGGTPYTLLNSSPLPYTTSDGRFTQLPYPPNPLVYEPGVTQTYTVTQTDTQTQASGGSTQLKESISVSQNVSQGFLGIFNSVAITTVTNSVTQTNTWLTTLSSSSTLTDELQITGSAPPNYVPGEFIGYQDNQFGTFMFYPN